MTKTLRAVIYARYSSDNQREESIDAQVRASKKYIEQKGYQLVGIYVDKELTGTSDKRPDFQRMIENSSHDVFDILVIHKTNRFARNRYDSARYKHKLRQNGVRVESATENLDGSPESILMESFLEGMAEYYSLDLAREVRKGLTENALEGKHTGGIPAYGLKVNPDTLKYEINEKESGAVLIYFESVAAGVPRKKIAEKINDAGFRTRKGEKFKETSFEGWADNRKYKGDYVWDARKPRSEAPGTRNAFRPKEEQIILPGVIPAIVPVALWDKVNGLKDSRKRKGAKMKAVVNYLLSGKVFCGKCKEAYAGASYLNKGNRYAYYRCQGKCGNKQIAKDILESAVIRQVEDQCFTEDAINAIVSRVQELYQARRATSVDKRKPIEQEIAEIDKKVSNWFDLLGEGIGDREMLTEKLNEAKDKKEYLTLELNKLNVLETVNEIDEEKIRAILLNKKNSLRSANEAEIKEVLQESIDKVIVYCEDDRYRADLTVRFFNGTGEAVPMIYLTVVGDRKAVPV